MSATTTVAVEETMLATDSGALPQLVRCTVWVLDCCGGTDPKFTFQESRHTDGAGVVMSSLAMKPCEKN